MSNQDKHVSAESYLSAITQRLEAEGFIIEKDITFKEQTFDYLAKRTKFEIAKRLFVTTSYVFTRFSSLDISLLRNFSATAFEYARNVRGLPLPFRFFYGVVCYPVAIVDDIDESVAKAIRSQAPPKHFMASEMLVVYSLASGALYYCEITPMWGALYYDQMRMIINAMLSP
ncbi:MAG: hypothetical protein PVJ61_07095 [Dehalococcoidia bacterium]|jgi:hypothetical protein